MKECQLCKKCFTDDVDSCPDDGMPTAHTLGGEPVLEGKYQLEKRLGQGGMGVVYKARHAYLKTHHAIKVILPDLVGNDPQLITRFRQEALAAAAIRHQNVVGVSDYGVVQGKVPFLVMEYVEGESLHDLLAREGKLSPERALELMSAICAGVGAAHHQGIVHRDLKPLNIMICTGRKTAAESVKILDFGLAKIKSGELLGSFIQAQTTGLMGSPFYMAPEQWADEEPDARADVYSLGVMLFQMLAGDVPFKGSSIPAIMKKHLSDPAPTFAEMGVAVPSGVEYAVRHTLEKAREARTQTVEHLVDELSRAVYAASQNVGAVGYATNSSLPAAPLRILTDPPQSNVFVDQVAVGQSKPDGWLLLEGVQSGNHRLRVTRDGFQDWESEVICDGKPQQIAVRLTPGVGGIPRPTEGMATIIQSSGYSVPPINSQPPMSQTAPPQSSQTGQYGAMQASMPSPGEVLPSGTMPPPTAARGLNPLVLAIIGIGAVLVLLTGGLVAAFKLGWLGGAAPGPVANSSNNSGVGTNSVPTVSKAEMIRIPGGKAVIGKNGADALQAPEYETELKEFWIDKTEVTNAEYLAFVEATKYNPLPLNWENGKPLTAEINLPVRYVNADDIAAFAEWRSKRDGVTYRLPTEEEWEFAARNGDAKNLYPWGDEFDENKAGVRRDLNFVAVGSKPEGATKAGVLDLIGNVWEWTSTPARAYKGSPLVKEVEERVGQTHLVVRGGFDQNKGTSTGTATYRVFKARKDRDKAIGFRLVRSG